MKNNLPNYTLNKEEMAIYALSKLYTKVRQMYVDDRNFRHPLPWKNDPRKGCNWRYFEKLITILNEFPLIRAEDYISAQIIYAQTQNKQCPISWLASEGSMERYAWYVNNRDSIEIYKIKLNKMDFETLHMNNLKSSTLFLYAKRKEYGCKTWLELFNKKSNGIMPYVYKWYLAGRVSKIFLSVSRSYKEMYDSLDSDIREMFPTEGDLRFLRAKVFISPKLKSFLQKHFKDEITI